MTPSKSLKPYTLHPTPHTPHPTPHTPHPTPYTLHPAPRKNFLPQTLLKTPQARSPAITKRPLR
ncbi:hypothetical protein MAE_15940 [Microcystis aeruginosa NIES-843]|uniref:Uncharacterized protein n=1 Tax=Microcystis aeruginosa (strain NIES-843 / IAM M-2473) TaxID=449447 RepID=B0JV82_MICAN|nr:hypothetical protein MAE_15940 [Microcystis aeruginosa NIES-843]